VKLRLFKKFIFLPTVKRDMSYAEPVLASSRFSDDPALGDKCLLMCHERVFST
jgi:hypothetical protein